MILGRAARWTSALLFLWATISAAQMVPSTNKSAIINSKHDFTVESSASVHATEDVGTVCVFCHTPHNANPGPSLWNQKMGSATFNAYQSTTLSTTAPTMTPQDSSKLCLSCHDGTIALGNTVQNGQVPFVQGSSYSLPSSHPANLAGYNASGFADDHPFAITPNPGNSDIKLPPAHDPVWLRKGKVQCTTCHEPHNESIDQTQGGFLVKNNQGSALCLTCHNTQGWLASSHYHPANAVNDAKYNSLSGAHTGYSGVANNGCESCHMPHNPQVGQRLIKFTEENTCYQCHGGAAPVSSYNLQSEFTTKIYRHPVTITPSVHDANEQPGSATNPLPETAVSTARHAECFDCHNGHAANPTRSTAPTVSGALAMVSGQTVANTYIKESLNQYEVCFKCHGDSANKPQPRDTSSAGIGFGRHAQRQHALGNPDAYNLRVELSTYRSFHPVTRASNTSPAEVPSLRAYMVQPDNATPIANRQLNGSVQIYCADCHANDSGRNLGDSSSGPMGPHASRYEHITERRQVFEPVPAQPGVASAGVGSYDQTRFALCGKCHDLNAVVNTLSPFPQHSSHMMMHGAACSTCHNPHASKSPMLIDFDTAIVAPYNGVLNYQRTTSGQGSCTLTCHGAVHDQKGYSR